GDSADETGDGGARAGGVDGHLAGAVEIPADERNFPEALLGEDAELKGEAREEHGRVHVAEVVGGVDGWERGSRFEVRGSRQVLGVDKFYGREREAEHDAGPGAGDEVLLPAGAVPQTADER